MNTDALRELDKQIAVALGYTVRYHDWIGDRTTGRRDGAYFLYDPNGRKAAFGDADPEKAWFVSANDRWDEIGVRYYATDANEVLLFCNERHWRLSFGRNTNKNQPYASIEWDDGDWHFCIEHADTPQAAAALALLAALQIANVPTMYREE